MSEISLREETSKPAITFFNEYGVHETPAGFIVSEPTWGQALQAMDGRHFGSQTVVLPELITVADLEFSEMREHASQVGDRFGEMLKLSQQSPEATFIVGSPDYSLARVNPFNAAYVIRNGQLLETYHKKMAAQGEAEFLDMDLDSPAVVFGGQNGVLVCKDFYAAAFDGEPLDAKQRMFEYMGRIGPAEARRMAGHHFIDDSVTTLYVSACWGVGMEPSEADYQQSQDWINNYYQGGLEFLVGEVMRVHPHLKTVVLCDRAPDSPSPLKERIATKPMSLVATR